MRISVDIPPDWMPDLRIVVAKAGKRSVAAFLRDYIQASISNTQNEQNTQFEQVDEVTQNEQVERDTEHKLSVLGIPVEVDPNLPDGTAELRGTKQMLRINNVGLTHQPGIDLERAAREKLAAQKAEYRKTHPQSPSLPKT